MDTRETIVNRIRQLCKERGITPNKLSNISAVSQATVKSILNGESKNPGTVTIKKLCDGLAMQELQQLRVPVGFQEKKHLRHIAQDAENYTESMQNQVAWQFGA